MANTCPHCLIAYSLQRRWRSWSACWRTRSPPLDQCAAELRSWTSSSRYGVSFIFTSVNRMRDNYGCLRYLRPCFWTWRTLRRKSAMSSSCGWWSEYLSLSPPHARWSLHHGRMLQALGAFDAAGRMPHPRPASLSQLPRDGQRNWELHHQDSTAVHQIGCKQGRPIWEYPNLPTGLLLTPFSVVITEAWFDYRMVLRNHTATSFPRPSITHFTFTVICCFAWISRVFSAVCLCMPRFSGKPCSTFAVAQFLCHNQIEPTHVNPRYL